MNDAKIAASHYVVLMIDMKIHNRFPTSLPPIEPISSTEIDFNVATNQILKQFHQAVVLRFDIEFGQMFAYISTVYGEDKVSFRHKMIRLDAEELQLLNQLIIVVCKRYQKSKKYCFLVLM